MNPGCETYPYDIANGVDLRDRAITASGFGLDLSKSQYLNINVIYSALKINTDRTGKVEAVYNVTAKEGQKYVDPGIYTIEATNTKTKPEQHTAKTVFVGSSGFLKAMADTGKSIDDINELIKKGYAIGDDGNIIEPSEDSEELQLDKESDKASVEPDENPGSEGIEEQNDDRSNTDYLQFHQEHHASPYFQAVLLFGHSEHSSEEVQL